MTTQPTALLLADEMLSLKAWNSAGGPKVLMEKAAAELRRLYWDELRVREHRDMLATGTTKLHAEIKQLQEQRDELLAALKTMLDRAHPAHVSDDFFREKLIAAREVARAAIAKAEGSNHSEGLLEMVSSAATGKDSFTVDCPACGGGGLIPDPTWDWVRCELCHQRRTRAAIAKVEGKS
jgi:hypothetical protein